MLTDWESMDPALRRKERIEWALHVAEGALVLLGPSLLAVAIMVYGLYRSYETTPWEPDGLRRSLPAHVVMDGPHVGRQSHAH